MAMFIAILVMLITTLVIIAASYLFAAGIVWLFCWCFGFIFTWKAAVGVWLIMILLSSCVRGGNHNE